MSDNGIYLDYSDRGPSNQFAKSVEAQQHYFFFGIILYCLVLCYNLTVSTACQL